MGHNCCIQPEKGSAAIKQQNIKRGPRSRRTPVSLAVEKGHLPVARSLIAAGADANIGDSGGWTPLLLASAASGGILVMAY